MSERKPLELIIFPPIPRDPRSTAGHPITWSNRKRRQVWEWCDARTMENRAVDAKRLTDAELAAEYWASVAHFNKMQWNEEMLVQQDEPEWSEEVWQRIAAPMNTFYRFATLPHHDEDES